MDLVDHGISIIYREISIINTDILACEISSSFAFFVSESYLSFFYSVSPSVGRASHI